MRTLEGIDTGYANNWQLSLYTLDDMRTLEGIDTFEDPP